MTATPPGEQPTDPGQRAVLIRVIDQMHERADTAGWPEAEWLAEALGWTHPTEMPDGMWLRARLGEVLR